MFGKGGLINPKLAKAMRTAMWMYDLTGGARIGKLHERISAGSQAQPRKSKLNAACSSSDRQLDARA